MSALELNEALLVKAAGWDAVKQARALLAADKVLSSDWTPPVLKGVVQAGASSYRAGLVIKGPIDIENLCTCRESRDAGIICAHSVAVGLHWLRPAEVPNSEFQIPNLKSQVPGSKEVPSSRKSANIRALKRAGENEPGEPLTFSVILPPNLAEAVQRGKVMVFFEGAWSKGRVPLNALPTEIAFQIGVEDASLLDAAESLTGGEAPGSAQFSLAQFAELLPAMTGHPRITIARQRQFTVAPDPWRPRIEASMEANGEILLRPLAAAHLSGSLSPRQGSGERVGERGRSDNRTQPASSPRPSPPARGGEGEKSAGEATPVFIPGQQLWVLTGDTIQPVALPSSLNALLQGEVRIPRSQVPVFISRDWPVLEAACDLTADFSPADFSIEPMPPKFVLSLAGGIAVLSGTLQCRYGQRIITPGVTSGDDMMWLPDADDPRRYSMRDLGAEQAALERLRRAGFSGPDAQGRLSLNGETQVVTFFARDFPRLEREWEVTLEERLERSTQKHFERIEPNVRITASGEQWFDLDLSLTASDGQRFAAADIQRLLLSGQSHTRLKNGKLALINTESFDEFNEVLRDCAPQQHAQGYRVSQRQAGFIEATLERESGWKVNAPEDWRQRVRAQTGEAQLECPPLGELETVLRPYQKQGVAWLRFLRENGFGGILADDMGLGKTLQVLALLAWLREQSINSQLSTLNLPCLVVCPTSLVFNWASESAKFTPGLRVLALNGPQRHMLFDQIPRHDLIVTSYALLRRDAEVYRDLEFDTVVLDEAQHIKNRDTQNAQAVKAIRARHRLVLTGTPMENSVLDLWSIFDFLMPGYLGSALDFRERYEVPIVKSRDEAAQSRLARRLKPFILRRLKRDVAKELPAKIEQVSFCDLTEDQAAVYSEILSASRREVLNAVGAQGLARSRMIVLNALLRLRQACCDLRLLKLSPQIQGRPQMGSEGIQDLSAAVSESAGSTSGTLSPQIQGQPQMGNGGIPDLSAAVSEFVGSTSGTLSPQIQGQPQMENGGIPDLSAAVSESAGSTSGKLDLFGELLEEVIDGGHRVLVFSQFTQMLALIRERLEAEDIAFCYLDGSTTDRAKVVQRFQSDASVPVFLISLKAGGVGLNLTGADTVIHFDPWWNPAVEDQATDRAHRIGQTRVVTSYKLIARGTVEETILSLQSRKRELTRSVLGDEQTLAEALTWEEIQGLLEA